MKTDIKIKYYNLKIQTKKAEYFFVFFLDIFIAVNLIFTKLISNTIAKVIFPTRKPNSNVFFDFYHKKVVNNTLFLLYHMFLSPFVLLNQLFMP